MVQINKLSKSLFKKSNLLVFIIIIAVLIRILFLLNAPGLTFDALDYDALGKSLSEGNGLNMEGIENTPYIGIRPVGYPVFLGAVYFIFGYNHVVVQILQIIMDLAILLMIFSLLKELFPKKDYCYIGAFLWSVNLMSIYYSVLILSEIPYLFLFMLSFYLFIKKIYIEKKAIYFLPIAVIMGYGCLLKSFLLLIFFLYIALFLLFNRKNLKSIIKSRVAAIILISLLIFLLLSHSYAIRNQLLFGKPISGGIGASLALVHGNTNMLNETEMNYIESLAVNNFNDFPPEQAIANSETATEFMKEKIMNNIGLYFTNTVHKALLYWLEPFGAKFVFLFGPWKSEEKAFMPPIKFIQDYGHLGFFKGLPPLIAAAAISVFLIWFLFLAISFYGLYLLYFKMNKKLLALLVIGLCIYFTGIYSITIQAPRYFIQNLLLLFFPFSVALLCLLSSINAKFKLSRIFKRSAAALKKSK